MQNLVDPNFYDNFSIIKSLQEETTFIRARQKKKDLKKRGDRGHNEMVLWRSE